MYNDNLEERYELAVDRVKDIIEVCDREISGEFVSYFRNVAKFIMKMDELKSLIDGNVVDKMSMEELEMLNRKLCQSGICRKRNGRAVRKNTFIPVR